MQRSYCIIGVGCVGGLFAYFLRHRHPLAIVRRPEQASLISREGLKVRLGSREEVVGLEATTWGDAGGIQCGTAIVATKAYDASIAFRLASGLRPSLVVSAQNGLGPLEEAASLFGEDRTAGALVSYGVTRVSDNIIEVRGSGSIIIGNRSRLVEQLAGDLRLGGAKVRVVEDIEPYRWAKLAANSAINPITALIGCPNGFILESEDLRGLVENIVGEVVRVAERRGVRLPLDPLSYTFEIIRSTMHNYSSMLQDLLRGVKTEIDYINGAIVWEGKRLGVPTPINQVLLQLVRGAEAWRRSRPVESLK